MLVQSGRLNPPVTVSVLPDDVLLEVFGFCVNVDEEYGDDGLHQDRWLTLVLVCQRWRVSFLLGKQGGGNEANKDEESTR